MEKLLFFSAAALSFLMQVSVVSSVYRAAVVEYHPDTQNKEDLRVKTNLENYIKFMADAKKKGAEIIVFPEGGLFVNETRSYVPDPTDKVVPCESKDSKFNKVIQGLSCGSKNNSIYSVVNLIEKRECAPDDDDCPGKGYYIFNTNVVFDRRGMVIARYAKYNLYDEYLTDRPKSPEMVFFDTDFGVRFGTFICFDILFSFPAQRLVQQYRITDFVFTTFWFSELPFLSALQVQRGWAEANDVNLLASGLNYPETGSGGSGIYNGKFGEIIQIITDKATSKLLIADVPKIQRDRVSDVAQKDFGFHQRVETSMLSERATEHSSEKKIDSELNLLKDHMHMYESEVIDGRTTFEKTLCKNDFCCHFEVDMDVLAQNYTCRAVISEGVRKFGKSFRGGVQSCGVLMCNGPDIIHCADRFKYASGIFKFKRIQIRGEFKLRNSFQMPSTLTRKNLTPLPINQYVFKRAEKNNFAEVSLELVWPVEDLLTFAIWGRNFARDGEPEIPLSDTSRTISKPTLLLSILAFYLFLH